MIEIDPGFFAFFILNLSPTIFTAQINKAFASLGQLRRFIIATRSLPKSGFVDLHSYTFHSKTKVTTRKANSKLLIIEHNGEDIGVVDLHAHHPESKTCTIDVLVILQPQTAGLETKAYRLIEDYLQRALACSRIIASIPDTTAASKFWTEMGFNVFTTSVDGKGQKRASKTVIFEKALP